MSSFSSVTQFSWPGNLRCLLSEFLIDVVSAGKSPCHRKWTHDDKYRAGGFWEMKLGGGEIVFVYRGTCPGIGKNRHSVTPGWVGAESGSNNTIVCLSDYLSHCCVSVLCLSVWVSFFIIPLASLSVCLCVCWCIRLSVTPAWKPVCEVRVLTREVKPGPVGLYEPAILPGTSRHQNYVSSSVWGVDCCVVFVDLSD